MIPAQPQEFRAFLLALGDWEAVTSHKPVNAQDDYKGFREWRTLRAAARKVARYAYRKALIPFPKEER